MRDLRLRFLTRADLCLHDVDASPQFLQLRLQGVALVGSDQLVQALLDAAKAFVQPSNLGREMAVLDQRIEPLLLLSLDRRATERGGRTIKAGRGERDQLGRSIRYLHERRGPFRPTD